MMRLVVCFKVLADYARLSEADWQWDDRHEVDMHFVRHIFNCYEESALEMALRIRESTPDTAPDAGLTALTVDDEKAVPFLRHLSAVGYTDGVRILNGFPSDDRSSGHSPVDLRFNPLAVSLLLSRYIEQTGQDAALFGLQGGDGDNGRTGLLVAERLGWPCISDVTDTVPADRPGCLTVTRLTGDGGNLVQTVRLPVVLIIGQAPLSLRLPNLRQRLAANRKPLPTVSPDELGLDRHRLSETDTAVTGLERPAARPAVMRPADGTAGEHARYILENCIKGRIIP